MWLWIVCGANTSMMFLFIRLLHQSSKSRSLKKVFLLPDIMQQLTMFLYNIWCIIVVYTVVQATTKGRSVSLACPSGTGLVMVTRRATTGQQVWRIVILNETLTVILPVILAFLWYWLYFDCNTKCNNDLNTSILTVILECKWLIIIKKRISISNINI